MTICRLLLVTAGLLLAAAAPTLAKEAPPTPVAVNAEFKADELAAQAFKVLEPQVLKGVNRVAVTVFAVEFITADHVSTTTSGFGGFGRATSSLYYKLLGLSEADFQALTNGLHAEFLARLQASGADVVPTATLQASALYRKLAAGGKATPDIGSSAALFSPAGLGVFGFARAPAQAKASAGLMGALSGIGNGFAAVGDVLDTAELSKELNAGLIELRLRVNFVELTDHNRGFFGRMASSAKTSGQVTPSIDGVMVGVQNGPLRSTLTMTHSLTLDPAAFSETREKATTAGDVAGAVLVGLIRMASNSKDSSSSSKEMETVADPVRYREVVGGGLNSLADVVVARLKAER